MASGLDTCMGRTCMLGKQSRQCPVQCYETGPEVGMLFEHLGECRQIWLGRPKLMEVALMYTADTSNDRAKQSHNNGWDKERWNQSLHHEVSHSTTCAHAHLPFLSHVASTGICGTSETTNR